MDPIIVRFSPDPISIVYKIITVEGCGYSRERGGGGFEHPMWGNTHTQSTCLFQRVQTGTKNKYS